MKQVGIPEIPKDLVILQTKPFDNRIESIAIQVRGIDEIGFPVQVRQLDVGIPRQAEDREEVAKRVGKLVENTLLHLMVLPVPGAPEGAVL